MKNIDEILTRIVANIIPSREKLESLLKSDKKLNVYFGIDPTFTRIHLGNAVPLRKLQAFVETGHNVTFLIGDFTALIGDTSDKDSERPVLTYEQIKSNFQMYKNHASKIVDFSKVKVRYNHEWLSKLNFKDVVKLTRHFSLNDFISRELIKRRLSEGTSVSLPEVLYPVMQGYDSYFMDTDIQIGGTDQVFNMQAGRTLQKKLRNKESFIIETTFPLEGTDGRKMSKSWGNAVWLDDPPEEMYGKLMSLKDELIVQYLNLATSLSSEEIENKTKVAKENPLKVKKELAFQVVKELHSEKDAEKAQDNFENTFQKRDLPQEPETLEISKNKTLVDAVAKHIGSKSEAKRLLSQKAIEVNEKVVTEPGLELKGGEVLKIGKKTFVKIKTK